MVQELLNSSATQPKGLMKGTVKTVVLHLNGP